MSDDVLADKRIYPGIMPARTISKVWVPRLRITKGSMKVFLCKENAKHFTNSEHLRKKLTKNDAFDGGCFFFVGIYVGNWVLLYCIGLWI